MLDSVDYKVLECLQDKGRMSWSELAAILNLSQSSTADRVKRLEEKGFIKGYAAILDYKALGIDLMAFIVVDLDKPVNRSEFVKQVIGTKEIEECYHIAGEGDFLLKVRCKNIDALEILISDTIKSIPGVIKTVTTMVLSSVKEKDVLISNKSKIKRNVR